MKSLQQLGTDLGALVEKKNAAYGDSFRVSGEALRLLYPDGVPPAKLDDALLLARIWDKMKRIATDNDAFGETPYQDIAGYGLCGVALHQPKKESSKSCPGNASVQDAIQPQEAPLDSAVQPTSERTTTSESEQSEPRPSQLHASSFAASADASAPTATAAANESAAARRTKMTHSAQTWLLSFLNNRCIACDLRLQGHLFPLSVAVSDEQLWPKSTARRSFYCCSEDCREFCMDQMRKNMVPGIRIPVSQLQTPVAEAAPERETEEEKLITVLEAGDILNCRATAVRNWIQRGQIKAIKKNPELKNSPFMVLRSSVDHFLKNRYVAGNAQ